MSNTSKKGIITADLVHSTSMSLEDRNQLIHHIEMLLNTNKEHFKIQSELYRGDSFQCLIEKPATTLRVALIIKTYIRSLNPIEAIGEHYSNLNLHGSNRQILRTNWTFDVRMGIGIGQINSIGNKLATSDGPAFYISGRGLDEIKNSKQHLTIQSDDEKNDQLLIESILLDALISKTSPLQCSVIYYKLLGYTEIQIAKLLEIRQSAVNQRSNTGNWNAINAMVKYFEKIYEL